MTVMAEDAPSFRRRLQIAVESRTAHAIILILTVVNVIFLIAELATESIEGADVILPAFATGTLIIIAIFMAEITLKALAFGPAYFYRGPHWHLHTFDAVLVFTSFGLSVGLQSLRNVASVLLIFRVWRVIKFIKVIKSCCSTAAKP